MPGPLISLRGATVDLPIYGANARSLKKSLVASATGGRIGGGEGVTVIRALDGIDLDVYPGDRVGLWGNNGAGKTTMLRVLAGAYVPTGGTAQINGSVTALIDIGLGMDPDLTGNENVIFRAMLMGFTHAEAKRLTAAVEEFSELGDYMALPMRTYSAGMALRLAFAVSTCVTPQILLMDEWLSVGDATFSAKAEKRLRSLLDDAHALVLASHDRELLEKTCNRMVTLEHGRIVEQRTIAEGDNKAV